MTLNAALDVTYRVRHLSAGESVRVSGVTLRAGGKGLNVASVLAELEADIVATGFIGGHRGGLIHQQLTATRITDAFVDIEAESRQTVTAIADDGLVAAYDEPGPNVSSVEWQALLNRLPALLERCKTLVLAGSIPAGLPFTVYAVLITMARDRCVPVLLDTSGPWLGAGASAGPGVVKVNRRELAEWAGRKLETESDVLRAARALREAAHRATVIATIGHHGSIVISEGGVLTSRPPQQSGNPIGAGDAFTAAWVAAADRPIADRLRFATAYGSAAVHSPHAGAVDSALAREIEPTVKVEAS
ncbi:MAG: 1-phosphofructokinase family hexose kinase [Acidimicrobiales bacterium]